VVFFFPFFFDFSPHFLLWLCIFVVHYFFPRFNPPACPITFWSVFSPAPFRRSSLFLVVLKEFGSPSFFFSQRTRIALRNVVLSRAVFAAPSDSSPLLCCFRWNFTSLLLYGALCFPCLIPSCFVRWGEAFLHLSLCPVRAFFSMHALPTPFEKTPPSVSPNQEDIRLLCFSGPRPGSFKASQSIRSAFFAFFLFFRPPLLAGSGPVPSPPLLALLRSFLCPTFLSPRLR